ncbi:response regulator [Sporichthya sp.]|uniref:response regulator n=1 Tax=Sporichthya sp. TaxID=65475 RepID=UPI00181ED3E0|nr:response regulator [Sporichthya sp.]MBA3744590.1 response regulator [Sporichthya sp.]
MARLLVVEDDPDILALVTARCRAAGHKVLSATSGQQALDALGETPPDVAILDVGLPMMTGFELLAELRKREGMDSVPAIFLSARVQQESIDAGRALGATYLTKPFIASALLTAIDQALPVADGSW